MSRRTIGVAIILSLVMVFGVLSPGHALVITVSGTSDLWLAGMPNGSTASYGDTAPGQSPVYVTPFSLTAGQLLTFSTTGKTDHCDGAGCGLAGPEGDFGEGSYGHSSGAENGISSLTAPIDSLIGVFLTDDQPSLATAPGALDFSTWSARDFASLAPELQQAFYIGDGLRNDGVTTQTFVVPDGATRLFLGTMDGYGWYNNVGEFHVTVNTTVPEPGTMLLLGFGLLGVVKMRKRMCK